MTFTFHNSSLQKNTVGLFPWMVLPTASGLLLFLTAIKVSCISWRLWRLRYWSQSCRCLLQAISQRDSKSWCVLTALSSLQVGDSHHCERVMWALHDLLVRMFWPLTICSYLHFSSIACSGVTLTFNWQSCSFLQIRCFSCSVNYIFPLVTPANRLGGSSLKSMLIKTLLSGVSSSPLLSHSDMNRWPYRDLGSLLILIFEIGELRVYLEQSN